MPSGSFPAARIVTGRRVYRDPLCPENSIPFLGTCGGFQHAVIEYARNVLGWQDAGHAETDSEGRMVIAPLSCSLVETSAVVELRANTLIARAYGRESIEEGYHCRYGVDSAFAAELEQGDLRVTGWDEEGEIRAVELVTHPFFVATLFQHERHALDGRPAPLVQALLRAAAQ
jgi:CTP synthase (UTP-ammonia lyase)